MTKIRPGEESLVPCTLRGHTADAEYFLEPSSAGSNDTVRAMCCLLRPGSSCATVRMVNAGDSEVEAAKGRVVGVARAEFEVSLQSSLGAEGKRRQVTGYKTVENLHTSKKREIQNLVNEYNDVFWAEGDQLPTAKRQSSTESTSRVTRLHNGQDRAGWHRTHGKRCERKSNT